MAKLIPADLTFSDVGHLLIIKEFAKKIKLVETLNAMVDSQMELAPGATVMAMVLDTLSGRTPLYRLEEFFADKITKAACGSYHSVQCQINKEAKYPHLFKKTHPNRSAGTSTSDCASHMAIDGALHAPSFGRNEYRNHRLEESSHQAAHFVYKAGGGFFPYQLIFRVDSSNRVG